MTTSQPTTEQQLSRYLVLVAYEPGEWEQASEAERQEFFDAHGRFEAFVDAHGRRISSAPLAGASTAKTVRHVSGKVVVTDGPFIETVEMIGGYYDIELPSLDVAVEAATLLPASYSVEVRPVIVITP